MIIFFVTAEVYGRFVMTKIHWNFSKTMHYHSSRNHHFFFVNDCVIVFSKNKQNKTMAVMNELIKKFIINIIDEFKWFLEMHIIKNHLTECLWLFQKAYIKKICKNLMKSPFNCPSIIFMNTAELLFAKNDEKISNDFKTLYQRKIGFLFFTVISTKSDIVFVVSKLFRFNIHFGKKHHTVIKWVLQYFYHMKNKYIRYENNKIIDKKRCLTSFVYANDVSFVNNTINRKNSQNYIMKLFNELITWKTNK